MFLFLLAAAVARLRLVFAQVRRILSAALTTAALPLREVALANRLLPVQVLLFQAIAAVLPTCNAVSEVLPVVFSGRL